jgi:hypothetical protein
MDADFPGVISWKKFNRDNLPDIPNLKRLASASLADAGLLSVSGCSGMMQVERRRVDPLERGAPAKL